VTTAMLGDISMEACVKARKSYGGTAPVEVRRQVANGQMWLGRIRKQADALR